MDARHVINGNAVYELPFGLGKPMLNRRGVASALAGGWQLTTTALARTGFPVNVLLPGSYIATDGNSGTQRPDLVPGVSLTPPMGKRVSGWINPQAFALPAPGMFGNAPRNLVRGPGTWQADLGAAKTFAFAERAQLQFRSEFYNIFNHPQLGQPQATFNASQTAGFGSITNTVNTSVVSPITLWAPVRHARFSLRCAWTSETDRGRTGRQQAHLTRLPRVLPRSGFGLLNSGFRRGYRCSFAVPVIVKLPSDRAAVSEG